VDVQAESLPTVFAGCALLGGAGLLVVLLSGLVLMRAASPQEVLRPGGRKLPWLYVYSFGLFFGLSGLLAGWLGLLPVLQLVAGLLAGLAVGGVTAWAGALAGQPRQSGVAGNSLVGQTGRVTLSLPGDTSGRVLLSAGQRQHLLAQSRDLLAPGDRVLIVADAGDLLDVLRWEGET